MKKIVFVTHEFGLFPGHGGVANYLHLLVSKILERKKDYKVYVLTIANDKNSELLKNKNLKVYPIDIVSYQEQGRQVLEYLKKIKPDYVECTDYLGLGLESLVYRAENLENELSKSIFITLHHTASRECYEWNDKVPVSFAPYHIREAFVRERTQMKLSDLNVAPSEFMNNYVSKNYFLKNVITISHPMMLQNYSKSDIRTEMEKEYDLNEFENKFIVNCISRIEGRKNQRLVVEQFIKFLELTGADAYLILVGNSSINTVTLTDFKQEIYEVIPEKYRNNILFYDFMKSKEKKNILGISDLSVLGSTFECLSLAMTESVCYEVPVICSKYCGFSDYMQGCSDITTFDPFKEDSLVKAINDFYDMTMEKRRSILDTQKRNLKQLADFNLTIHKRLEVYENAHNTNTGNGSNTLIVDETNFQKVIDSSIIEKKYDSILVHWYFDKNNATELVKLFNALDSHFDKDDVICYGGHYIYLYLVDLIIGYIPFYIKGIEITEQMRGKKICDIICDKLNKDKNIYCLTNEKGALRDTANNPSIAQVQKREYFRKCMLDDIFYKENKIDLEEYYAE